MDAKYGPLSAEFYDLTKPLEAEYPDVHYYADLLGELEGKSPRILEIGAGTGRLLVPLLEAGLRLEALEPSPFMRTHFKRHLKARRLKCPLLEIAAEELDEAAAYDAIVVSFGSFQLFDEAQADRCLKAFHRALKPGAQLFVDIDVIRPDLARAGLKTHGARVPTEDGAEIVLEGARRWDFVAQLEHVFLRYEKWRDGRCEATEMQDFALRWYGVREFHHLLERHGFKDVRWLGDYHEAELHAETGTICFRAGRG